MTELGLISSDHVRGMLHAIEDGPDSIGPFHRTDQNGDLTINAQAAVLLLTELLELRRETLPSPPRLAQ